MNNYEDAKSETRRQGLLLDVLAGVVATSMSPLSEQAAVAEALRLLDDAWADVTQKELRAILAIGDPPNTVRTAADMLVSATPPSDMPGLFRRLTRVEAAADRVAAIEAPARRGETFCRGLFAEPLLSLESERRLGLRSHGGDSAAVRELVMRNTRLAIEHCRRPEWPALGNEDLLQEACRGLLRAAEKFDPHKGFRFSTYATFWIRQAVGRAIADKSRTVRVPVHVVAKLKKLEAERERVWRLGVHDRAAAEEAVSSALKWSAEEISSVDEAEIEIEPLLRRDNAIDRCDESPEDLAVAAATAADLHALLNRNLTFRERDVLTRRCGLGGSSVHTLDQISRSYNITRERVRQIEDSALKKLATRAPTAGGSPPLVPDENQTMEHPATSWARRKRRHDAEPSAAGSPITTNGDAPAPREVRAPLPAERRITNASLGHDRQSDRVAAEYARVLLTDLDSESVDSRLSGSEVRSFRRALAGLQDADASALLSKANRGHFRAVAIGNDTVTGALASAFDRLSDAYASVTALETTRHGSPDGRVVAALLCAHIRFA